MTRATAWDRAFPARTACAIASMLAPRLRGRKQRPARHANLGAGDRRSGRASAQRKAQCAEQTKCRSDRQDHRVDGTDSVGVKARQRKRGSIEIPWTRKPRGATEISSPSSQRRSTKSCVKSIVRAHAWLDDLSSGRYASIEDLAAAADLHPKVVRQGLRLAFLPPDLTRAALDGEATIELKQIPKLLPLSWREQHRSVG